MLNAYSNKKKIVTLMNCSSKDIEALKSEDYYCPACKQSVYIKNGRVKLPHFAHFADTSCSLYSEAETKEHLTLKQELAKWCEQQQVPYEMEKFLPALNQRPDLLIGRLAIEIQCSPLSIQRLIERTKCYQKHGYQPIWICSQKLIGNQSKLNELTKNLCYYSEKLGFYLWTADAERKELTLLYHIEEDWSKRVYTAKKSWLFYQSSLLEIFDFPAKAILYHQRKYNSASLMAKYYQELKKRLAKRDERVRSVQAVLYNNRLHLLCLPNWFYAPGLHIFCCRRSDLLFRYRIWTVVQFFDKKVVCSSVFLTAFRKELEAAVDLFSPLPNVVPEQLQDYCTHYLLKVLMDYGHIQIEGRSWKISIAEVKASVISQDASVKSSRNKDVISATPVKSMIR